MLKTRAKKWRRGPYRFTTLTGNCPSKTNDLLFSFLLMYSIIMNRNLRPVTWSVVSIFAHWLLEVTNWRSVLAR